MCSFLLAPHGQFLASFGDDKTLMVWHLDGVFPDGTRAPPPPSATVIVKVQIQRLSHMRFAFLKGLHVLIGCIHARAGHAAHAPLFVQRGIPFSHYPITFASLRFLPLSQQPLWEWGIVGFPGCGIIPAQPPIARCTVAAV